MKKFDEIDWSSKKLIVIDFRSDTCGPCKQVAKIIDTIQTDDACFYECSADDDGSDELMAQYAIRTVPTLVFIKDGTVVARLTGMQTKETIEETINNSK